MSWCISVFIGGLDGSSVPSSIRLATLELIEPLHVTATIALQLSTLEPPLNHAGPDPTRSGGAQGPPREGSPPVVPWPRRSIPRPQILRRGPYPGRDFLP